MLKFQHFLLTERIEKRLNSGFESENTIPSDSNENFFFSND